VKDPLEVAPTWSEETVGDWVTSASAIIALRPPSANPEVAAVIIYLEIEEGEEREDEENDPDSDGDSKFIRVFRWNFGISEEDAGFGETVFDSGESSDLEQAKFDCWAAVIEYLRSDSYTDQEIADSV
jgi:hypothetical protein